MLAEPLAKTVDRPVPGLQGSDAPGRAKLSEGNVCQLLGCVGEHADPDARGGEAT
jgi:hypothetical protein